MYRRYLIGLVFAVVFGAALLVDGGWSTPSATGATVPPAPADNDNFVDATAIANVPYNQIIDIRLATLEPPSEPAPTCGYGAFDNTVWYRYQPSQDVTLTARAKTTGAYWHGAYAVYTGSALGNLSQVACDDFYYYTDGATFRAEEGTTYYIQIGGVNGYKGVVDFSLEETPPPIIDYIYHSPSDPSVFDWVQFNDSSWDPANIGIASWFWDFGDGTSADVRYPGHKYDADGEYIVRLDVTTHDDRTASAFESPLVVKTRDVAITKFTGPTKGRTGRTAQIKVGIHNERYPEVVRVYFYRSTPDGFEEVGRLQQNVKVHKTRNKTTEFTFNYTFTHEDAVIGKVTFKVEAKLVDGRDALPTDNAFVSWPVEVRDKGVSAADDDFDFGYREYVRSTGTLFMPIITR